MVLGASGEISTTKTAKGRKSPRAEDKLQIKQPQLCCSFRLFRRNIRSQLFFGQQNDWFRKKSDNYGVSAAAAKHFLLLNDFEHVYENCMKTTKHSIQHKEKHIDHSRPFWFSARYKWESASIEVNQLAKPALTRQKASQRCPSFQCLAWSDDATLDFITMIYTIIT